MPVMPPVCAMRTVLRSSNALPRVGAAHAPRVRAATRGIGCGRIDAMTAVRVGIVGVGNCASSLVQGLSFHGVDDVRVVSAFDVAPGKVGRDLAEAILAPPN